LEKLVFLPAIQGPITFLVRVAEPNSCICFFDADLPVQTEVW